MDSNFSDFHEKLFRSTSYLIYIKNYLRNIRSGGGWNSMRYFFGRIEIFTKNYFAVPGIYIENYLNKAIFVNIFSWMETDPRKLIFNSKRNAAASM